jgi:hypothetical protein
MSATPRTRSSAASAATSARLGSMYQSMAYWKNFGSSTPSALTSSVKRSAGRMRRL